MINKYEVYETNQMIAEENLDVRTITLGISLLDCIDADLDKLNENEDINAKIEKLSRRYGEVMLPKYDEDKQLNYSEQFGLTIL